MPLTLLLDLDDTLLDSNISLLAPAFLKKLAGFLAGWVEPQNVPQELLAATNWMSKKERPYLTKEFCTPRPDLVDAVEYAFQ